MDYEMVQRIAERISDHDISVRRLADWKCPYCGISGDGIDEWALHVARELISDLSLQSINRWVPHLSDGGRGDAVGSFHEAELLMAISPVDVIRIDREYRFVSRWFNPSREG
jgi:hypothetical protein